ncbi:hypothetical protein HPB48_002083 [Haemaphysalis longicornis]|uniref:Uncharacterized protein n=1 Tax=Haemaphysalis longicornis TaxID=44386 RepID=A0A9J6FIE2_HAELO|nr:hypothetical protein HPB48_002083 [Haemaphysalis longicornis]
MDTAMFNDLWNKLETLGRAAHNSMSDKDGKTALMWAAAEGQANTVGRLVQAGARTLIEDARRVSLLSAPTSSARDHRNRDALFRVLLFIRRRVQRGTELLLTNGVFVALASCGRRNLTDALVLGPLFHLCACLLHDKADYSKYVHRDMVEAFIQSDALELAREVLGDGTGDFQRRCTALLPVLPVAEVEEGLQWVREHLSELEGPCREFAAKKDMLVYWTEGEDVKTAVMWERYKENFTRLYLEARGTPLDFGGHARDEQAKEACRPFAHHALLQSTGCRPKSPVPASKKTNQKALSKKSARPRAVPAMLQVTFREDTRVVEEKPPKVQPCPPRPEVKQPATEPMTVFRAMMSKAPAAITKVLPLVGYANAVKSNLPKEEPPLEQVATQEDTKQTRFKFTADGLRNVDKKLDYSFLLSPIISPDDGSCSSQPLSLEAYAESICLRRVHSDPSLESLKTKTAIKNKLQGLEHSPSGDSALNGENRAHPAPGIIGPSTVAKGTGDNSALTCGKAHMKFALTSTVVHYGNMPAELASVSQPQRLEQSVTVSDKCERILACRRTHCLQEHMLKEILQSRELKTAKDQDTASATLILAQTLFRAMNCLQLKTADKTKGTRDARIENRPLCAVDEDCGDASTKQGKSGTETVWLGSFASVAAKEAGQEEKPTLSAVWLSENMRWKNAFCEIANVPLSTLTDVHGFFYNQEKKRILPPASDERLSSRCPAA